MPAVLKEYSQQHSETNDTSPSDEARHAPDSTFCCQHFTASFASFRSLSLVVVLIWLPLSMASSASHMGLKQCQFEPHGNERYKVHSTSDLCFNSKNSGMWEQGFKKRKCTSVRSAISFARARLEDREQDVAKIRGMTRGVVQDLLGVAASAAIRKQQSKQGVQEEEAIDVVAKPASKMVVGFVGCGAISEAVVKGMCHALTDAVEVVVSPRNARIAASLAQEFPTRVTIAADNQAVLDASDVVCIAVTPQVYEEVLKPLSFRPEHIVVSFMSTVKIASLQPFAAPASSVVRMIPMPPIAQCLGPLPIYPPLELIQTLFGPLGTIVALESEDEFAALMSASSLMAPFYNMQQTVSRWIAAKGLDPAASAKYTSALFHGLSSDALGLTDFEEKTANSQTPKGINEQSLRQLQEAGFYSQLEAQLDTIYARVNAKP